MTNTISEFTPESDQRQKSLSRWDSEGGAGILGPQMGDALIEDQINLSNAELVKMRVRIIALENLVIALLANSSERQIDKSKLFDYLLHPVNSRGKLGHFSRYGYSQGNWEDLHASLLEHAQKHLVTRVVATKFGTKYIVTGVLNTPSGRQPLPIITAVWQKDTGEVGVRLITAYPD